MTLSRISALPLGLVAAAALLAAAPASNRKDSFTPDDGAILIDARTPEEYADGHLQGARMVDFNAGEFEAVIPHLDPDAEYLLYCRSGNRSGQAMALMRRAGIMNVSNLGSREQAAEATGLPIATG
ncbi:rhodanese-like domain-containing protein [Leucobacter sp. wl10]|uniref:rhodanese-like domain-containing protein n=1 Tax=Leucobacter sp. wl10 TaxID=2304677 RepID=UPI000E5A59FD|nr:rhodanese-like domain-containing protein [Leucobacter sp. wl10]RGE18554.1 rhodanese-like domain-containing protein [Leucobacter sp. wl10]